MVSWEQVLIAVVLGAVVVLLWRRGLGRKPPSSGPGTGPGSARDR